MSIKSTTNMSRLTPRSLKICMFFFLTGIAGDGVGPEAPQFAQTSLKYLHLDHPLRRACIRSFLHPLPSPTLLSIRILLNPYFERLTMTVIMINCVTLGMYQPCEDSGFCDRKCQILKVTQKNWKQQPFAKKIFLRSPVCQMMLIWIRISVF